MSPGVRVRPLASITRASGGTATDAPTDSMTPSRKTTVADSSTAPETVTTRAPTIAYTSVFPAMATDDASNATTMTNSRRRSMQPPESRCILGSGMAATGSARFEPGGRVPVGRGRP